MSASMKGIPSTWLLVCRDRRRRDLHPRRLWQEFRRDAWEWKVWLGVTVWYIVMWAMAKSK
jgi:hypothetical protein